ncbi:MAG: (deoxy)nucleoside triphosphate pyrophosphohydrolase [Akkermansia sp.]|nr:(deoxy)nucleoside triphosphate pyrophosphohydrolase [Akkermansia sp.]
MRLFYAFPPALQARKAPRCVSIGLHPASGYAIIPRVNPVSRVVEVVAALILNEAGQVLAVKCPERKHGGGWEFPGGKIEPGETPQAAVVREIAEELGLQVQVGDLLHTVEWDYPAFHLSMQCFLCRIAGGELQLHEHTEARWLGAAALHSVPWLPADVDILPHLAGVLR